MFNSILIGWININQSMVRYQRIGIKYIEKLTISKIKHIEEVNYIEMQKGGPTSRSTPLMFCYAQRLHPAAFLVILDGAFVQGRG